MQLTEIINKIGDWRSLLSDCYQYYTQYYYIQSIRKDRKN